MVHTILTVAYLAPILIGITVGTLVFGGLRSAFGKPRPNCWLRLFSALASALLSGMTGLVAAGFITAWLNSLSGSNMNIAKLTVMMYVFAVETIGAAIIGAVTGCGPWRSTARTDGGG